jgi:hypothetical protein
MHRVFAAGIAILALAALVAQFLVSSKLMGSPGWGNVLWRMAGYFTILTNVLVTITFALKALSGWRIGASWNSGLTLWILVVGAVYHGTGVVGRSRVAHGCSPAGSGLVAMAGRQAGAAASGCPFVADLARSLLRLCLDPGGSQRLLSLSVP